MSRAATPLRQPQPSMVTGLPGLPRSPLTTEQQLTALKRVQEQADQRVKLGAQFFKAAEARTGEYRQILDQIKAEQETLRSQMQQDVSRSFHTYDQWIGEMENSFAAGLHGLESKMDRLQHEWAQTQQRIASMMRRSEAMLDQCRIMLDTPPQPAVAREPEQIREVDNEVGIAEEDSIETPPATPCVLEGSTVAAPEMVEPAEPAPTPVVQAAKPAPVSFGERPAPQAERLHQPSPPPVVAPAPPPVDAAPIVEVVTNGHSIADAIASTDEDIESPEFYRQVLEKLREQDDATP